MVGSWLLVAEMRKLLSVVAVGLATGAMGGSLDHRWVWLTDSLVATDCVDCQYQFENGDNPSEFWCWGSYCDASFVRWGEGDDWNNIKTAAIPIITRNQQFCFESHATFTYNESQEFTFRGDDDIWVFINRKIAVDNGGAHLAAPGHVVLKNLNTKYGAGFLEPGKDYPIDIFFCDRRTTMSNVIIKTNMYIKQSTGLDLETEQTATGGL